VFAWTGNHELAGETYRVISLLSVGTLLNALMSVPYALQLAYAWTSLAFRMNVLAVIVLVPLIIILAKRYGIIGPPVAWILLNSGYLVLNINVMHQRLIPGEKREWYLHDLGAPLIVGITIAGLSRLIFDVETTRAVLWMNLLVVGAFVSMGTFLACSRLRGYIKFPSRTKTE
jgi:O-antigen/teichoic acid export membrane protein